MLWAGRHQDGHGESRAPSAGGGVLAPCVFVLSCPASGFPLSSCGEEEEVGVAGLPRLGLDLLYQI